jgi:hypothetical protein
VYLRKINAYKSYVNNCLKMFHACAYRYFANFREKTGSNQPVEKPKVIAYYVCRSASSLTHIYSDDSKACMSTLTAWTNGTSAILVDRIKQYITYVHTYHTYICTCTHIISYKYVHIKHENALF